MRPERLQSIKEKVVELASALEPESPRENIGKIVWSRGQDDFELQGAHVDQFEALLTSLATDPVLSNFFSEDFLSRRLSDLILAARRQGPIAAEGLVQEFASELETYSTEQTVYVPISKLYLTVQDLPIGNVVLRNMDQDGVTGLAERVTSLELDDHSNVEENAADAWIARHSSDLLGKTFAVFSCVAEPIRAREIAEAQTVNALELIMFANTLISYLHPMGRSALHLEGLDHGVSRFVAVGSDRATHTFHVHSDSGFAVNLTRHQLELYEQIGFFDASNLIRSPSKELSDLDRGILLAIHWLATSLIQRDNSSKLLMLAVGFEALLGQDASVPVQAAISEAGAIVLADSYEGRVELRNRLKDMYDGRSRIAHGTAKTVSDAAVDQTRWLLAHTISTVLLQRRLFQTKKEFRVALEREKLSRGQFKWDSAEGRFGDIGAMAQERGRSKSDLARELSVSEEVVDSWIEGKRVPHVDQLRRLGSFLECLPESFDLAPEVRFVSVEGYCFLIKARQLESGQYQAEVVGVDWVDARTWPQRPLSPPEVMSSSPSMMIGQGWSRKGSVCTLALDACESAVRKTMESLLTTTRLATDPEDWVAPPKPSSWPNL